ncbi:MAG: DUF1992 domain-containing protein [Pyrinomonadaceae bacterium]
MEKWETLIDRMIRESMERGEFDDLAGKGEPIELAENPFEDPDLRMVHRLLRNAGFGPAWLEERKDIDAQFLLAKNTLVRAGEIYGRWAGTAQWQRAMKEFCETIAELNKRIKLYNLKAPNVAFHRKVIDAEALIQECVKISE